MLEKYQKECYGTMSFRYDAPRWANVSGEIKYMAQDLGLDVKEIEVQKFFIREKGYVVLEGYKSVLEEFKYFFKKKIEVYNRS